MRRSGVKGEPDFARDGLGAAARGDLDRVRSLLAGYPDWLSRRGPHGRSLLWEAAYAGREGTVVELLERGAPRDAPGAYYTPLLAEISPLCAALTAGRAAAADRLRERGATASFHDACYLGDTAAVRDLLSRQPALAAGPRTDSTDREAAAPLYYAVAGGGAPVVRLLLEHGADARPGGLLLRWALWRKDESVLRLLLERGADPRASGVPDWVLQPRLRELAARYGGSVDVDAPNWLGFPLLVNACRGNHNQPDDPDRLRPILAPGAAVNVRDHKGKTALHRAAQAGFVRITALLLERGADPNAEDALRETPLFDAARAGRAGAVPLLLAAGADPDHANHRGETPRMLARRGRGHGAAAVAAVLDAGPE